jgi:hypothetical protein
MNLNQCKARKPVLFLGSKKSCLCYTSKVNSLHILKAVVRTANLSVVIRRGRYLAM